ncbi:AbrB/MazE/SpoVT family DNA-binding domain-containing protein [Aneurinibacillus sp. Ricciae_BoGa-3]|uniref:AbrB/MazE/SpoVT family DNA-binding domain-containing protein n=1 Tax=Aneurinibacillus sp. Ricciae_BoGa-3 TaxID=3022697 RepID=UPI0023413CA9|nr:AbrB/MazE/SpoVT family DNA-binding domain-containing protein [Aneurinibacillus sp. Ricciae_BoGa-3]WCK55459.1 AbrB/MazE/SpoVT family DNA-binding domain-containing protein [Aneurinibacillus sp. Ricciae_BoGa-3]
MKATGVVRKVDELGRVVLPIELRRNFFINDKDPLKIFVTEDTIVLKKYEPSCIFCGSMEGIKSFKGKRVCETCANEILIKE